MSHTFPFCPVGAVFNLCRNLMLCQFVACFYRHNANKGLVMLKAILAGFGLKLRGVSPAISCHTCWPLPLGPHNSYPDTIKPVSSITPRSNDHPPFLFINFAWRLLLPYLTRKQIPVAISLRRKTLYSSAELALLRVCLFVKF